ncbi:MAG: 5-formyltetrahydrofolate cyclo-ligase [Treponemataceae bacterium]
MNEIQNQKKEVRKTIRELFVKNKEYCAEIKLAFENAKYVQAFFEKLVSNKDYKTIFGYAELPDEFPCLNLLKFFNLQKKKITALPVVKGNELIFREFNFTNEAEKTKKSKIEKSLVEGERFGILEPDKTCKEIFSTLSEVSETVQVQKLIEASPILVLTPARAFTKDGARLGRGGGFYDKLFAKLQHFQSIHSEIQFTAVGLVFSFQILEQIPTDARDFQVHKVLTEK